MMIRPANKNDAMRIAEIIVFGWRSAYGRILDERILYKQMSVVKRYESLADILEKDHNYYVYEDDEIIKGFFLFGDSREEDEIGREHEKDKVPLELIAIYVDPGFKQQGIGSKLIRACEEIAKSKDKNEIRLWVLEENKSARQFYEKHGFESTNLTKKLDRLGVNEVRYRKII